MEISFIGLGKLGLCSATCFASKGHHVIGVDNNQQTITALQTGQCPIDEPGLTELLEKSIHNMTFTTDYSEAIKKSAVTLIIVPTPSKADGSFNNELIETVLRQIAPALREKKGFHIVDVVSTVMPTSSEKIFKQMLEELTGKKCGEDFGLVYNPEFIALGSVIRDFLNPDMVLIGASDDHSAQTIKELYSSMVDSSPTYALMSLVNAEITKLSLNCFVTMKISYANELAAICERLPGANVDVITSAIGADSRVGSKYIKGGLGFGGPCFPRDNLAFQRVATLHNLPVFLSPSVVKVNHLVIDRIENAIIEHLSPSQSVALLGLSYKHGTHIVEESQSLMLADRFLKRGYKVFLHDPKALPEISKQYKGKAELCNNINEALQKADAIILLTDWPEYRKIDWHQLDKDKKTLLFDSWRIVEDHNFNHLKYAAIGIGKS